MDRKYDTYVPSALPSASLGRRRGPPIGGTRTFGDDEPTDELEKSYQQWNTRIDKEVKSVVEGLGDLVRLADVSYSNPQVLGNGDGGFGREQDAWRLLCSVMASVLQLRCAFLGCCPQLSPTILSFVVR